MLKGDARADTPLEEWCVCVAPRRWDERVVAYAFERCASGTGGLFAGLLCGLGACYVHERQYVILK